MRSGLCFCAGCAFTRELGYMIRLAILFSNLLASEAACPTQHLNLRHDSLWKFRSSTWAEEIYLPAATASLRKPGARDTTKADVGWQGGGRVTTR
jgi:hypothetical protein